MMNYFFYKDYIYNRRVRHADPLITSAIMISVLEFVNLFTAYIILDSLYFHLSTEVITASIVLMVIVLLWVNISYFKRKEKVICDKYKNENSWHSRLGNFLYVGYILASFALLFLLILEFKV